MHVVNEEGKTPTHCLISGKGRLFIFDCLKGQNGDGCILNPFEILVLLQRLRAILDYEPMGSMVPILTHDERTAWAKVNKIKHIYSYFYFYLN